MANLKSVNVSNVPLTQLKCSCVILRTEKNLVIVAHLLAVTDQMIRFKNPLRIVTEMI